MRKSVVLASENRNCVVFNKDGYKIAVLIEGCRCAIVSLSHSAHEGAPFLAYVYAGKGIKDTYQVYLHLLGKMCLKARSSKYFASPIWEEHCKNGEPGIYGQSDWENWAMTYLLKNSYAEFSSN